MVLEPQRDPVRSLVISVEILSARHRPHAAAAAGGRGRARTLATFRTALSRTASSPRALLPVTSMFTPPRVLSTRLLLLDFCYSISPEDRARLDVPQRLAA